ncbi:pirin family protein [Spongiactinospora sp. TRM90649]|uniref:pirin family protein n=1 Tax=Spongiactinospora sp. TRM90649 TaxID=3031114 RepID=UPI0023F7C814|nr:pirin family protein [Spongiactinospora sp. TRM90649]MDF5752090.1 pirin family protein [Spongiactinospora sp. TRM90649]
MSNTEQAPDELRCGGHQGEPGTRAGEPASAVTGLRVLAPREVPLGGPRAMRVRRTLPRRERSLIGAWCFADHYGPDDVARSGGMDVPPHPHTGLQTVSWLFEGEIEHRDSTGAHALVRPGELNLMTAGHGVCHSEVSTRSTTTLHGVQLWVALPGADRDAPRDFRHHVPTRVDLGGPSARVFLGELAGESSPVPVFSPLLGAEIVLPAGGGVVLEVDAAFEHGILADTLPVEVAGVRVEPAHIGYLPPGRTRLEVANPGGEPARAVLLGGTPFEEEIVMWWNFVGRSHDDIVEYREEWGRGSARFGDVRGYQGEVGRLPAPPLPNAVIRPRRNPAPGVGGD